MWSIDFCMVNPKMVLFKIGGTMPKIAFSHKTLFQLIIFGYHLLLISSTIVGCLREDNLSSSTSPVAEEQHYTPTPQNETVLSTRLIATMTPLPSPSPITVSPIASSTPTRETLDPTVAATIIEDVTTSPDFQIERVFDLGGKRLVASPDSSLIAVSWDGETIGLYNETGQKQRVLLKPTAPYFRPSYAVMDFSPDSRWLAVSGLEEIIWIWDVASGDLMYEFPFWGPVTDLAFSPDGQLLAVVSPSEDPEEHGVAVFDIESETLIAQMRDPEATSIMFLEDGRQLLVGAAVYYHPDREVGDVLFIWDYETNEIFGVLSQYGTLQVIALDTERKLVATALDNTLHLINLQTLNEIDVEMPETGARALSFDSAGNIWALSFDGVLSQWDADGKHIRQQQFVNATDFAVIPNSGNLLIAFPEKIWEVSFP
jgi:WD40 repeat protein